MVILDHVSASLPQLIWDPEDSLLPIRSIAERCRRVISANARFFAAKEPPFGVAPLLLLYDVWCIYGGYKLPAFSGERLGWLKWLGKVSR